MMNLSDIQAVYFIGAGGIGMSALARYFLSKGKAVAGYDRTPSELTECLVKEGAQIHYEENAALIPDACKDPATTLVVYTPAVPQEHAELAYFRAGSFEIHKRAQVLGLITRGSKGLCVAGTHGKTTTSTMTAHLLHQSHVGCTAFLGGISKNYGTNLLLSADSPYTVIEADEFDHSFHWLSPWMSVITATDPDHLDIYGTREAYLESFRHYTTPSSAPAARSSSTRDWPCSPMCNRAWPSTPTGATRATSMQRISASGAGKSTWTSWRRTRASATSGWACPSASTSRTAWRPWRLPTSTVRRTRKSAAAWQASRVWCAASTSR